MKTKYSISFVAIIFAVFGMVSFLGNVSGQEKAEDSSVKYPIAELGNCANKAACGVYCDKPANVESCLSFAEKNNLMSKEEVEVAKNFILTGDKGPGGCKTKDSCEAYCNDISRIDECVSFAEKNNLMPPAELAEAKKIQAAIARGVKPPPCGSKKQCDAYCEDSSHMEECINFGVEAGFMQGKELEDAKKMLSVIKKGVKPPPCKGKEACDKYCSTPANLEVCMNFAVEAGFMNEEEKANSQKMLQAIKKGVNPPKCKSKEECDAYCGQEEHLEECVNFAEAAGFMSSEDADRSRKTMGKGPGGCKGKEECEAFCGNPDNQETCYNFYKENGMVPEDDLKKTEEGRQGMLRILQQASPEVIDCLNSELGAGTIEKLKAGTAMSSQAIGNKMKICFDKVNSSPRGTPGEGGTVPQGQTGPGGCTSPEECKTYCESHQEECQKFQPGPGAVNPGEQIMPQQSGPGGCKTTEECQNYCTANPDVCRNFSQGTPPQGQPYVSPMPNSQSQPVPQEQYNYPAPGQTQPACEEGSCQYAPLPGQPLQQPPMEGSTPVYPQPVNPAEPLQQQPPVYTQPPIEQQQLIQPPPENPLSLPTSFDSVDLLTAIPKIISLFLKY